MSCYWVSVEVHLAEPLALVSDDGTEVRAKLRGFVQELGCTADGENAMQDAVRSHITRAQLGDAQKLEVVFIEVEVVDPAEVEADETMTPKRLGSPRDEGVWFETPRSFYSED